MSERLEDVIHSFSNDNKQADIVLLIDGSKSITQLGWDIITFCLRHLVGRINFIRSRCAIVQFSDAARIEHEFTHDRYSLYLAINNLSQMKDVTNTEAGLTYCGDMFAANVRDAERCVILLTDGDATDSPENKALELREKHNVAIYGIGIGSLVSRIKLETITSLGCCFLIESLEHLRSVFARIATRSFKKPEVKVLRRLCNRLDIEIACSEPIAEFHIELFDASHDTQDKYKLHRTVAIPNPDEALVETFVSDLRPKSDVHLRVYGILKNSGQKTEVVYVSDKTLHEKPESSILKNPEALAAKTEQLKREIQEWIPDESVQEVLGLSKAKIILLGRLGEGKSSYVNTIFGVLKGLYTNVVVTMEHHRSVTPDLNEHHLPYTNIILMDTYGWEDKNYSEEEQRLIMLGVLGDGYKEGESHANFLMKESENNTNQPLSPAFKKSVHAVILVCDADTVTNDTYMTRLKQFETTWKRFERSTMVLLTKCDNADKELLEHPELIFDSEIVDRRITTFVKATGINRGDVYPCINRTSLNESNPEVRNYLALKALHACLFSSVKGKLDSEAEKTMRRLSLTPSKAPSQSSLSSSTSSPRSPSPVSAPSPSTKDAKSASVAESKDEEEFVLMIPVKAEDQSVQYVEVYPRERTLMALKETIVSIKPFSICSIDNISQVSILKKRGDRVFDVVMVSDEDVMRLHPYDEIAFKTQ